MRAIGAGMKRRTCCWQGFRHHQLCLVDRHWPRGHADFGNPVAAQAAVAQFDQPVCRSDDTFCRGLRRIVSGISYGPTVVGILAFSISQRDGNMAAIPQPADVGCVRGIDIRNGFAFVLVCRIDT